MTRDAALMELIELVERLADIVYVLGGCAIPEIKAARILAAEVRDECEALYELRRKRLIEEQKGAQHE